PKLGNLGLPVSALYQLAAPSTPEAAKIEVIERAQAGEAVTVGEVKRVVDAARGKPPARKKRKPQQPAPADAQAIQDARATRPPAPVSGEPEPQAAAESSVRPTSPPQTAPPPPRDDIGPASAAEAARLRVCVEKLENERRLLNLKVEGHGGERADVNGAVESGN